MGVAWPTMTGLTQDRFWHRNELTGLGARGNCPSLGCQPTMVSPSRINPRPSCTRSLSTSQSGLTMHTLALRIRLAGDRHGRHGRLCRHGRSGYLVGRRVNAKGGRRERRGGGGGRWSAQRSGVVGWARGWGDSGESEGRGSSPGPGRAGPGRWGGRPSASKEGFRVSVMRR